MGLPVTVAVLVLAAGSGSRARRVGDTPKQYAMLSGASVLAHAIRPFLATPGIGPIQVVIRSEDRDAYEIAVAEFGSRLAAPVVGGATRQESVRLGLAALATANPHHVLIHDAARPFATGRAISAVIAAARRSAGAILALPVVDTLKQAGGDGRIVATLPRERLWRAQTPQAFEFDAIRKAHEAAARNAPDMAFTDDAAIAEWAGVPVELVEGDAGNFKITTAEDLDMAQRSLGSQETLEPRTGTGFDVHRFTDGDHVWLCGVRIPHTHGLEGHSDADVGLHALTDAILGALGDGDIGDHFPPSDPQWKGAASHLFLAHAARRVAERGGRIANADVTLLCEAPRIGPYRTAMRLAIADCLGLGIDRIGVKATTTEGLGFTGRREGIAAMASATLLLPADR